MRRRRNPRDFYVHDRYLGGFLDFGSLKTAARYAKHKFGCAPAGDCVFIQQDETMIPVNAARPHLARRVRGLRNPFNATKPAEWATMSKKLRKAWNRKHWRPEQWKCDLALKREATRKQHRAEGATRGAGLEQLAEKIARQNPRRRRRNPGMPLLDRCESQDAAVVEALLRQESLARAYDRAPQHEKTRILGTLIKAAEHARTVRRGNPRRRTRRRKSIRRERDKWTTLPADDRRRIEREELASGFAVNPRRGRKGGVKAIRAERKRIGEQLEKFMWNERTPPRSMVSRYCSLTKALKDTGIPVYDDFYDLHCDDGKARA